MSVQRGTPAYVRWIITVIAGLLTVFLTAVAFWLSYEHLHDVAAEHGLSGVRAWAWPATLDTFIVIGEVLILRASLMSKVDKWAWFCAAVGSLGSITLNVVGVGSQGDPLDYTVAAVPPVAALFAFGILMRQLHQAIQSYMGKSDLAVAVLDRDEGDEDWDPEETHYAPDAATWSADEPEAEPGMDAGLDSLRVREWDAGHLRREALDAINRPRPDVPAVPAYVPDVPPEWTPGQIIGDNQVVHHSEAELREALSRVPDFVPGDNPLASVNGQPAPRSVPSDVPSVVPRRTASPRTTGLTARVRQMIEDNPHMNDDEIKDKFPDDLPNSVRTSIRRVRKARGEA